MQLRQWGHPRIPGHRYAGTVLAILLGAALVAAGCACSAEASTLELFGMNAEPPVFINCKAVSGDEFRFRFSRPVTVSSINFDPPLEVAACENGSEVRVLLVEPCGVGVRMIADLLVADEFGNTLNVLTPLRSRNGNMPKLLINEVRTEYSKPKVEFIEFLVRQAGDLGGMRLFINGTPEDPPFYEFPQVHVEAGEYIVLHLRTLDGESVDETGTNLAACPTIKDSAAKKDNEAAPGARDLWVPGLTKHINRKGGAIYLMDQDDRILDALLFCENQDGGWTDEKLASLALFLCESDAWTGADNAAPLPQDAVSSANTAATRTLNRRAGKDTNSAADWYTTVSSGNTPGKLNNDREYAAARR